jgi:hypothetical protein
MNNPPEFVKPMLNTRGRRSTSWSRVGDGGWCSAKIARSEGSREANKIMRDQIYECAPVREFLRQVALTPLHTLLGTGPSPFSKEATW